MIDTTHDLKQRYWHKLHQLLSSLRLQFINENTILLFELDEILN